MIKYIDKIISEFRTCFTRKAAFEWFDVISLGFMVRSDSMGVTSILRDLCINECLYTTMRHFFRSASWSVNHVFETWCHILLKYAPIMRNDDGSVILVGDGTKISKEAKHMPGVKKLHQDSENVIRMYAHRFNIECAFKTMKQLVGVGCYHFRSKYMPKLNKYRVVEEILLNKHSKTKIYEALKAIEKYVMICCISVWIIQILLLTHSSVIILKC